MTGAEDLMLAVNTALGRHLPFSLSNEKELQADVYNALIEEGFEVEREVTLAEGSIIDHTARTPYSDLVVGIECKIRGDRAAILRQVDRYVATGQIDALMLLTQKSVDLPDSLGDVPLLRVRPSGHGGLA